jgi:hypothetical protein
LSGAGRFFDQFLHRFEGKVGIAEMGINLSEVKNEVIFLRQRSRFAGDLSGER